MVPSNVLPTKEEKFWIESTNDRWKKIEVDLEPNLQESRRLNEENKDLKDFTPFSEDLSQLAKIVVFQSIKNKTLFGGICFSVHINKLPNKIAGEILESVKSLPDSTRMIVFYNSISFIPEKKDHAPLLNIQLEEISVYRSYPKCLVFQIGDKLVRLDTERSFEIFQLFNEYKQYLNLRKGIN